MCFSASVSFGAATILTVIGVVSTKKIVHSSQRLFAGIPFLFALQQICEGILWLIIDDGKYIQLQFYTTHLYLLFAQTIWPIYVPLSILLLENQKSRKSFQKIFVVFGIIVSSFLTYCLFTYYVEAKLIGCHVWYLQEYPINPRKYGSILYIAAILLPPLFSHIKNMWKLGVFLVLSFVLSYIFYNFFLISVWCFFASLISIGVLYILNDLKNSKT